MPDEQPLADKVAIVTGAGRGLGRAIALAYARAGASLVLTARGRSEIEQVRDEARALGPQAIAVAADISVEADVKRLVAETHAAFGTVDVLVNNAAVAQGIAGVPIRTILDVEPWVWDALMAVNCRGPFLCMRAVLPTMLAAGGGSIVNISTNYARRIVPGLVPYGTSKAALEHLTLTVAAEFADRGVRVNILHPGGAVDTSMFTPHFRPADDRRLRPPDIIGPAAVWLASDAAAGVTGQIVDCREWNAARDLPT